MHLLLQHKIQAGFALALAFLLLTGICAWWSEQRNMETFRMVDHTREVIETLDQTLVEMLSVETGSRGFAIAGDEAFLQSYQAGVAAVPKLLETVKDLTQKDPRQQQRLAALAPLIQDKIDRAGEVVRLRRSSDATGAIRLISSGLGQKEMDEIRTRITEMKAPEDSLLLEHRARAQALSRMTMVIVAFGGVLSLGMNRPLQFPGAAGFRKAAAGGDGARSFFHPPRGHALHCQCRRPFQTGQPGLHPHSGLEHP